MIRRISRVFKSDPAPLKDAIAAVIAGYYPIAHSDIKAAYELLKSWDATICLCEFALTYGYSSAYHCLGIFLESAEGQNFRAKWVEGQKKPEAPCSP